LHSSNKSDIATRISRENTWLIENGFTDELLSFEETIGKHIQDNMSILCLCDISKIKDQQILKKIIGAHSYVVTDEPFVMYKGGN
jgi:hypothetical protein